MCTYRAQQHSSYSLWKQDEKYNQMKQYMPVKKPIYMREFPISWRDIDVGIEDLHQPEELIE